MKKAFKITFFALLMLSLSACGCSMKNKNISFTCIKNNPVDHDIHLIYQDKYEGVIKENAISDLKLYYIHLYDNADSYNSMKSLILESEKNGESSQTRTYDDEKYTITIENKNEDNISNFISEEGNKLYAKDFIKSLEEMEYKCEIKGAKRSDIGLQ